MVYNNGGPCNVTAIDLFYPTIFFVPQIVGQCFQEGSIILAVAEKVMMDI